MPRRQFELIGAPFDGGATLGWPGSRYAPARIRTALGWMTMRIQSGEIYSLDTGEIHQVGDELIVDGGDVAIIPHDLMVTLETCAAAVTQSVQHGRVPILLGGDDSLLLAGARGLHDAVGGSVGIIHFDAHLDLMDENARQGRFSHSSGMRRALDLERISARACIQLAHATSTSPAHGHTSSTRTWCTSRPSSACRRAWTRSSVASLNASPRQTMCFWHLISTQSIQHMLLEQVRTNRADSPRALRSTPCEAWRRTATPWPLLRSIR
jgi:hypothetical protein